MKKVLRSFLIVVLALIMVFSSLIIITAAETRSDENSGTGISSSNKEEPSRYYELVWRYRYYQGRYQKRRWNLTLGEWYDPDWINVN